MNKSKYKNLKFKTQKEFEKWLKDNTLYEVEFYDNHQDFLKWYIDNKGEILHSDMLGSVWNSRMVDLKTLRPGCQLKFQNGNRLIHIIKTVTKMI